MADSTVVELLCPVSGGGDPDELLKDTKVPSFRLGFPQATDRTLCSLSEHHRGVDPRLQAGGCANVLVCGTLCSRQDLVNSPRRHCSPLSRPSKAAGTVLSREPTYVRWLSPCVRFHPPSDVPTTGPNSASGEAARTHRAACSSTRRPGRPHAPDPVDPRVFPHEWKTSNPLRPPAAPIAQQASCGNNRVLCSGRCSAANALVGL